MPIGVTHTIPGADFSANAVDLVTSTVEGFSRNGLIGLWLMRPNDNLDASVTTITDLSGLGNNLTRYGSAPLPVQKSYGLLATARYGMAFEGPALPKSSTIIVCITPTSLAAESAAIAANMFLGFCGSTQGLSSVLTPFNVSNFVVGQIRAYPAAAPRMQIYSQPAELNGVTGVNSAGYGQANNGAWLMSMTIDQAAGTAAMRAQDGTTVTATSSALTTRYDSVSGNLAVGAWYNISGSPSVGDTKDIRLHGAVAYNRALTTGEQDAAMAAMMAEMASRSVTVMTA